MIPLVVKIGGSLAKTGRLPQILHLVALARRPVVVVPGGGTFADAVREAQRRLSFDDETAHRMALLAMHQTGVMMTPLAPRLRPAETITAIRRAWRQKRVPVWLPSKLCLRDRNIPADWSITSDGLAARRAERLGAKVVLIKSRCPTPNRTAAALAREGLVDPAFADIVARAGLDWKILGPGEEPELSELICVQRPRRRSAAEALRRTSTARP
jgi:hypothetical protein